MARASWGPALQKGLLDMLGIFALNISLSREDAFRLNPHRPVVLLGL